jgi:hypothetical protein
MSYTNPQQFVPQQYAQQNQRLQDTIAGTTAKLGAQYAQQQKELRAKNERITKENKITKGRIADRSLGLLKDLGVVDNANPSVDFTTLYKPMVEEYKNLSEAIAFGTSEDPIADQKRVDEIYTSVGKITGTMSNMVGFTQDFSPALDIMGEQGGLFEGSDPNLIKGVSIMSQKLDGERRPKYKDPNDLNSFVWEIYDGDGKFVYEFSQQRLEQISKGNDEMLTTIPDQTKSNTNVAISNPDIFETKTNNGATTSTGNITDSFLLPPTRSGDPKRTTNSLGEVTSQSYNTIRKVNKYGTKENPMSGIYTNANWNTTMNAAIAEMYDGDTDRSVVAFNNSQLKNVKFTEEDFRKQFNGKYTEGSLPKEFLEAINDQDGYEFDFDKNMSDEEKEIFSVAYKKNYLTKNVRNDMPGQSQTQNLKESRGDEIKRDREELETYVSSLYDPKKHRTFKNDSGVNASQFAETLSTDESIDPSVRETIVPLNTLTINKIKARTKEDFMIANKIGQTVSGSVVSMDAQKEAELKRQVNSTVKEYETARDQGKAWDVKDNVAVTYDQIITRIGKRQGKLLNITKKNEPIVYE